MQTVLIVIHLLIVLTMIGVVLLQRSEGGGLGIGGGGGFMTSRGSGSLLTRTTAVLAAMFFATSLMLSIVAGWGRGQQPSSIIRQTAPVSPSAPAGGGMLDALKQQAPSGPQVPQSK